MTENPSICRICLSIVYNNVHVQIEDIILQKLRMVSPTSDTPVSQKSILCVSCSEKLQRSFNFKMTCVNNEIYLKTFRIEDKSKLALQEILRQDSVQAAEAEIKVENGESVCRLCFEFFDNDFYMDLSRIDDDFFLADMLEKCLPEIDLNRTLNPCMCHDCAQSLQGHFNLVSTFLDTNDKISDYLSCTTVTDNNNTEVDLLNILNFTEGTRDEIKSELVQIKVEKEEERLEEDIGQLDPVKVEEVSVFDEQIESTEPYEAKLPKEEELERESETIDQAIEKNADGLYACPHCDHETTKRPSLLLHLLTHQGSATLYKCDKCSFSTKWRTSLRQHSWLHDDGPTYQCPHCPYKTRYRKHLKRHSKRHGELRTQSEHQCSHCDYSTSDENRLTLHRHSKHKDEDVENFSCALCDFSTPKKCLLAQHRKRTHEKLVCDECGFCATSLWRLNDHKLRHRAENEVESLRCALCPFKTKYKQSLRSHVLRHCSGVKREVKR